MGVRFFPTDGLEKLEFFKVLELLKHYCISDITKARIDTIRPVVELGEIQNTFNRVQEWKNSSDLKDALHLSAVEDIKEDLFLLNKENYVLSVEAILRLNHIIQNQFLIQQYFNHARQNRFPALFEIVKDNILPKEVFSVVHDVFTESGEMRENASPDLLVIIKSIRSKQQSIDHHFNSILRSFKKQGLLTESTESYRNGRRVLSVPAEHKRKIRGIIHDESQTGRTVFIEPEGIIELNNDLFELIGERKREVYRIIKRLCAELHPYAYQIEKSFDLIIQLEMIRARYLFGASINGNFPKLQEDPTLSLKNAFHPLLLSKNLTEDKKTIPFDLTLLKQNRILLISGPNAGGKSILMKAVGLIQLMVQSGIPVPVDSDSSFGIFNCFCVDIGDQQSIEDDLSTYSSRLKNMKDFVENLDSKSLLLIDEFGSGTDPKLGGAIAEALLSNFLKGKSFGVITSHYSNLKLFAYKSKGIVNGAMIFNKAKLEPTYEMKIGRPGSSFAYEIAKKAGLQPSILNYAKKKIGDENLQVENLLSDLQTEKVNLEKRVRELELESKSLQRLIKNYEQLQRDLDIKRKKLKLESKAQRLSKASDENKELEKLIREIKETQNIEKAKQAAQKIKKEKAQLSGQIQNLKKDVYYTKSVDISQFKKGDFVKMKTGSEIGEILSIKKKKAEIAFGLVRMFVPLEELLPSKEPIITRREKSVHSSYNAMKGNHENKLDIRGYSWSEAARAVEEFLDNVLLSNAFEVKIIHGVGNGVLKKLVWQKAKEYNDIQSIFHPEEEQGGEGVSIIQL